MLRWMLLTGLAVSLGGCQGKSGEEQCLALQLDTPVSGLGAEPATGIGTPREKKGPVDDILCCGACGSCSCNVDCTQPLFQQGELLALPGTKETFEGYPQLGDEYAICDLWAFDGRVKAVWWAPMY